MSERFDHASEARFLIDGANQPASKHDWGNPEADRMIATAQVHATLALVEQQRIANIIALFQRDPEELTGGAASDFANEAWDHLADGPIRQALGLDK